MIMTTTPNVPPYANDTPAELADAARGLANNVRSMAESWRDHLPPEMQAGGLFVAGMEIGDANFGPGQGAAMLCQSLVELIQHNPGIVAAMVPQLAALNRLVLAAQAQMLKAQPAPAPTPKVDPIHQLRMVPSDAAVKACGETMFVLDSIYDYAHELADHVPQKSRGSELIAEIFDLIQEGRNLLTLEKPQSVN